jgi:hypothetical protein
MRRGFRVLCGLLLIGCVDTQSSQDRAAQEVADAQRQGYLTSPAEQEAREKAAARRVDEDMARHAEEARAKQAEADAHDASEKAAVAAVAESDERVQQDPEAVQLVLSMNLCIRLQDEQKALASIVEEKQNAKIAGVVDLAALKELQDAVVQSRKASKRYRDALAQLKRKPLGCDSKPVTTLWDCGANPTESACAAPQTQSLLRLSQKLADAEDDDSN